VLSDGVVSCKAPPPTRPLSCVAPGASVVDGNKLVLQGTEEALGQGVDAPINFQSGHAAGDSHPLQSP
jgi:hypothetical protein